MECELDLRETECIIDILAKNLYIHCFSPKTKFDLSYIHSLDVFVPMIVGEMKCRSYFVFAGDARVPRPGRGRGIHATPCMD